MSRIESTITQHIQEPEKPLKKKKYSQGKRQSTDGNLEMTQMLESLNKHFKVIIITMLLKDRQRLLKQLKRWIFSARN